MKAASAAWFVVATMMLKETSGTITSATASADDGNVAANAIDGSVLTRWSAEGDQWLQLTMDAEHMLTGVTIAFYKGNERSSEFKIDVSTDGNTWQSAVARTSSSGTTIWNEAFNFASVLTAKYILYTGYGNSVNDWNSITKFGVVKGSSIPTSSPPTTSLPATPSPPTTPAPPTPVPAPLNPNVPPSSNFDLQQWYVSVPIDEDNSGTADIIYEEKLNNGYESEYFYTGSDGGMVFYCPVEGYRTSTNTNYVRTEMREMLRGGNTSIDTKGVNHNNWVFGSAPAAAQALAGGVDGTLRATLAVNHVTTTGLDYQIGRVIVGQIHAEDDEPCRLYYRKLPGNTRGSVYFASQERGVSGDVKYTLIGDRSDSASDPSDGIALDEKWSYEIKTVGNLLTVTIKRDGKDDVSKEVTMVGYDIAEEWMYFKAGVYNQNNSGDDDDHVTVTFYALSNSHN